MGAGQLAPFQLSRAKPAPAIQRLLAWPGRSLHLVQQVGTVLVGAFLRQPRLSLRGVPVFLYHGLGPSPQIEVLSRERKYWVGEKTFRQHLRLLRTEGCRIAPLGELWSCSGAAGPGSLSVALTFDDGRVSDYQIAWPRLLEAGARADFFVNTAYVGREGFLDWRQIAEMQRSGMSFQSHSHNHVDLLRLSPAALERQLKGSRELLEDRLSCAVEFLSAPYGRLNAAVIEAARQAGYRAICSSWSWPARPGAPVIHRVVVYAHTAPSDFRRLFLRRPAPFAARAARAALVYLPKNLVLRLRPAQLGAQVLEEKA